MGLRDDSTIGCPLVLCFMVEKRVRGRELVRGRDIVKYQRTVDIVPNAALDKSREKLIIRRGKGRRWGGMRSWGVILIRRKMNVETEAGKRTSFIIAECRQSFYISFYRK